MSADQALGRQFSPPPVPDTVDQYRSGGVGHLPDDPTHSVVGMVPTRALLPYREHDGNQQAHIPGHDDGVINGIRHDIRNGGGITNPLMLEYDKRSQRASLGEGNHRLAAALAEGVSHVPVRVYGRATIGSDRGAFLGGPDAPVLPRDPNYMAPEVHPHHWELLR